MSRSTPDPEVLFVGGTGRSGSTLLAGLIGDLPGAVDAGEIRFLWQRGLLERRLCACGVRVPECPFWSAVLTRAYPRGLPDPGAVHAALTRRTRLRRAPSWLWRAAPPDPGPLAQILPPLYAAIAATAGAQVVVDNSKLPTYAALLATVLPAPPRVVHLVRDPRAAAYSWMHVTRLPDGGPALVMERRGVLRSALLWTVWNAVLEALWRGRPGYLRVTYEGLADDPAAVVAGIAAHAGLTTPPQARPPSALSHAVAGNPHRLQRQRVTIRRDDRWRRGLGRPAGLAVSLLALPLLRRYGYPVRPPR